jgi:hypothetical protein
MYALPSKVFKAISPKLSEDVVGTLPGTELRFSSILTDIFMDQFKRYVSLILGLI